MRTLGCAFAVAALLLAAGRSWCGGDEDKEARAILDKAIQAHGGEANLAKVKATYVKGTGTIHFGDGFPFTGEWYKMGTTHSKLVVDVTINGQMLRVTKVVNGDKGWQKIGDGATAPLKDDEVGEEKAMLYAAHVELLLPLKDKAFKLSPLGEMKVGDRPTLGLRVTRDGQRDVSLYFDKATRLLVKMETTVKDQGQEFMQETYYSNHKLVEGCQLPHKLAIKRDGKAFVEGEFSDVRVYPQKLDDSIFAMP
jgi:hypothetical protein